MTAKQSPLEANTPSEQLPRDQTSNVASSSPTNTPDTTAPAATLDTSDPVAPAATLDTSDPVAPAATLDTSDPVAPAATLDTSNPASPAAPDADPGKTLPHVGEPAEATQHRQSDARAPLPDTISDTSPKPPGSPPAGESSGRSKMIGVVIFILLAFFATIIGAAAMWMYTSWQESSDSGDSASDAEADTETEDIDTDMTIEELEEESYELFSGEYVSALLPDGWEIIEYYDGDGSDMLTSGSVYTGLTGLTVSSPTLDEIFTLKSVWGIGGIDACDKYYEFPDSDPAYYNEIVARSAVHSITPVVTVFTQDGYSEFNLFDITIRRVNKNLFWDQDSTDEFFNATCGLEGAIFVFNEPTYVADGHTRGDFQFGIHANATNTELETLETILDSLVAL